MSEAKVKLKDGAVYLSDNGRAICIKCAGASALYTGRDISGQKVERIDCYGVAYLKEALGRPCACERGCTVLSPIAGPDGWPMVASKAVAS